MKASNFKHRGSEEERKRKVSLKGKAKIKVQELQGGIHTCSE